MISRSKLDSIKNFGNSGNSDKKDIPPLTLADILPHMGEIKQKGKEHVGTCPVCGKEGHLYAHESRGKLLVYCQHCNADFKTIVTAFRDYGASPINIMDKKSNTSNKSTDTTKKQTRSARSTEDAVENIVYEYKSPAGAVEFCKRRLKWADGHKEFRFFHYNDFGKAINGKPDDTVYLYNLDLLTKADPSQTLYIVEGEKCADALTKRGFLATTSCIGAKKEIKLSEADEFALNKFADKVIIPDNDAKGMEYANAPEWGGAKILSLPEIWADCPEKGDIADYFEAGLPEDAVRNFTWDGPAPSVTKEYFATLDRDAILDRRVFDFIFSREGYEVQLALELAENRAKQLKKVQGWKRCKNSYLAEKNLENAPATDNVSNFLLQPIKLRTGEWITRGSTVMRDVKKSYDRVVSECASPIPVLPTEILNNIEDNTEKIRIAYFKEGKWSDFVVARSTAASAGRVVDLADLGLEVNSENSKLFIKYLADVVALNLDILPRSKSVSHMGWIGDEFLPYTDEIKLDCEEQYRAVINAVSCKGELADWVKFIAPLRENIYLRLMLGASFASPLIGRVNALPFVLHLWGGTGNGKTVGAMVAASVWGNPGQGKMLRTMNTTVNSMMNTAAVLANIPFIGDELQTIKTQNSNYDTLIMRICEGIDRGRMNSQAQLQVQKSWANAFIFTGEEPCTGSASGGGVKNRVIEIECCENIVTNGNEIVNFVKSHYGTAGKAFIDAIFAEQLEQDVADKYQQIFAKLLKETGTTEKQAMAMALIVLGDSIAEKHIFNGSDYLGLNDVAPFVKSISEIDVALRAYEVTMGLIGENTDKFDTPEKDASSYARWGSIEPDGTITINKMVLEREMGALGFNFNAVKKKWAEKNWLLKNSQGRYVFQTTANKIKGLYVKLQGNFPEI